MIPLYVASLIWLTVFMISSYSAMVNGTTWGIWVTGICLWILFAVLIGVSLFIR